MGQCVRSEVTLNMHEVQTQSTHFHNSINAFHDAIYAFHDAINAFMTQSTHFATQSTHFATQSTHFATQLTHFTTQSKHFTTQSTHLMTHPLEQKQIKALSSYTFHHLNANLEGNNKYTIDMANIHTCATCGKIFRRKYDLRRHENTVHSEDTSSGEDEDSKSKIPSLKMKSNQK